MVKWHGKIRNAIGNGRDCTDNFRIKYWPSIDPNNYTLTELLEPTMRQFEIENLLPGTKYAFQVNKNRVIVLVLGIIIYFFYTEDINIVSSFSRFLNGTIP